VDIRPQYLAKAIEKKQLSIAIAVIDFILSSSPKWFDLRLLHMKKLISRLS
jgi:hypothetical protein